MAILTVADLKTALGTGAIYSDAEMQTAVDSAIDIVTSMLTFKRYAISAVEYNKAAQRAIYYTPGPHLFNVGDNVTISTYEGSPFTGTQTIVEVTPYYFKTDKVHSDQHDIENLRPYGSAIDNEQAALYDSVAEVHEAALAVAIDVWQTRMGTAGATGLDMQPAPYRLGRSLFSRVSGLLGKHIDLGGYIG